MGPGPYSTKEKGTAEQRSETTIKLGIVFNSPRHPEFDPNEDKIIQ